MRRISRLNTHSSVFLTRESRELIKRMRKVEGQDSEIPGSWDGQKSGPTSLEDMPEDVLIKFFHSMTVEDMKKSRMVCTSWNDIICDTPELMRYRTCFVFDGRKDDNGSRCQNYFDSEGDFGATLWNTIRIRSSSIRHINWIDITRTTTITRLEFHNCSLHWSTIIKTLTEFQNLTSLQDIQDMYLWDYAMFNEGISEEQSITETNEYPQFLETGRMGLLSNLRHVKVHRSNLRDCTTYLKILELRSDNLETLEITTDCNFPLGRSTKMYTAIGNLLLKNAKCLTKLRFPFKNIYTQHDFRLTEDQRPFRDFLGFIHREAWANRIQLPALTKFHLSFPLIYLDEEELEEKLKPFLQEQKSLKNFLLSIVSVEAGKEDILAKLVPPEVKREFEIYINDGRSFPDLGKILDVVTSLTIQTWRVTATEVKSVLLLEEAGGEPIDFSKTKEFQYFSKSHTFKDFNVDLLALSFSHITHLNLVDHNTRVEHRHSSEAPASIEDEHFQIIILHFLCLQELQIIANMAYLTDSGLTGLKQNSCKRMLRTDSFVKLESDLEGVPLANLRYLRSLTLRGVGIKITDVSLHFAFGSMEKLKKVHIFGSQQTTPAARIIFYQKFPNSKGYDLEI